MADILLALVKAPRTNAELREQLDFRRGGHAILKRFLDELRAVGLVYISDWKTLRSPVFAWQPTPFERADAKPRPRAQKA